MNTTTEITPTAMLDNIIKHCSGTNTVPTAEITDMLLDLRILLTADITKGESNATTDAN